MASCRDCICEKTCRYNDGVNQYCIGDFGCPYFKDRSKFVELPCKVGNTVYVVAHCVEIMPDFNGTGAAECPFESTCDCEDCDDNNIRIFESKVKGIYIDENNVCVDIENFFDIVGNQQFGKTVFLTKEQTDKALEERT